MAKRDRSNIQNQHVDETENTQKPKRNVNPKTLGNIKLTKKQEDLIEKIDNSLITVITGPAGTSKTFIECYYAMV